MKVTKGREITNSSKDRMDSLEDHIKCSKKNKGLLKICCYCSVAQLCLTVIPWTAAHQASLSFTSSWGLLKLMSLELVMSSKLLTLCVPLLLWLSILSNIRVFSKQSVLCITWPKYWSFSFSISASNDYSGLISFRIDWFDFLAVQGTLKSLLQTHNSKASALQCSAFFRPSLIVQLVKNLPAMRETLVQSLG